MSVTLPDRAPTSATISRRPRPVTLPLSANAALVAVFFVVSALTVRRMGVMPSSPPHVDFPGRSLLDGYVRFDGEWYRRIADHGYSYTPGEQSAVAFFPSYPLAIRAAATLVGDAFIAGILVTIAAGFASAVLAYRWLCRRMNPATAGCALAVMLLYPYGWYRYGAVYADALFLASALGAFLLVESDRYLLAGVVGAIATAARPTGIAVAVGLALCVLQQRHVEGAASLAPTSPLRAMGRAVRRLRPRDTGVLLSLLGVASFMGYLWVRWGDPLLFWRVQGQWEQGIGWHTVLKVPMIEGIRSWTDPAMRLTTIAQACIALACLASVPRVGRRFGWGYAGYVAALVLVPVIGTSDFQGTGRYLMAAFPTHALLGEWLLSRARWRTVYLAASGVALIALMGAFARGFYLA